MALGPLPTGKPSQDQGILYQPKIQYGFEIPRDYRHAVQLDNRNGNTKWQDANALEMEQHNEYDIFTDHGLNAEPPPEHKKTRVHLVFGVKHNGQHIARLVADGHLTIIPVDNIHLKPYF